jgi:hypothetical protein
MEVRVRHSPRLYDFLACRSSRVTGTLAVVFSCRLACCLGLCEKGRLERVHVLVF